MFCVDFVSFFSAAKQFKKKKGIPIKRAGGAAVNLTDFNVSKMFSWASRVGRWDRFRSRFCYFVTFVVFPDGVASGRCESIQFILLVEACCSLISVIM